MSQHQMVHEIIQGESSELESIINGLPAERMPAITVNYSDKLLPFAGRPADAIGIDSAWAEELGLKDSQFVTLIDITTGTQIESRLKLQISGTAKGEIKLSPLHKNTLKTTTGQAALIVPYMPITIDTIKAQLLKHVGQNRIALSSDDYSRISQQCKYYQIINNSSGSILYVTVDEFEEDSELAPGTARLSRYQRALLREGVPAQLSEAFFNHIKNATTIDEGVRSDILAQYPEGILAGDLSYNEQSTLEDKLKQAGYGSLQISPVYSFMDIGSGADGFAKRIVTWFKDIPQKIADLFLGQQSKTLRSGRPYDIDESERIVRLAPETMTLLGLEETDKAILKFGNKTARVRAMPIDDSDQIEATNVIGNGQSISYIAGIPASVRNELGMNYIDMSVQVKRDTKYLFGKHMNIQLLSVLGLVIAVFQMGLDPIVAALISIALTPFVLFAILSPERARVSKD